MEGLVSRVSRPVLIKQYNLSWILLVHNVRCFCLVRWILVISWYVVGVGGERRCSYLFSVADEQDLKMAGECVLTLLGAISKICRTYKVWSLPCVAIAFN